MQSTLADQTNLQTGHVKVDIMGKEGENEQEGFLTALYSLPTGTQVILRADDQPSYTRDRAFADRFIEEARGEAGGLGADFEVSLDMEDEYPEGELG